MTSSSNNWPALLRTLSHATITLRDPDFMPDPPCDPAVRSADWLGCPPASAEEISRLEARLDVRLPPSYREFLSVTNGWGAVGKFIDRVFPAAEVAWCRDVENEMIDGWMEGEADNPYPPVPDEQYFIYGKDQNSGLLRAEYLPGCLQVSDIGDVTVLLLNPAVQTPEGEWEAWFFAAWLPGAQRYRSFYELMEGELESALKLGAHADTSKSIQSMPRPANNGGSDELSS